MNVRVKHQLDDAEEFDRLPEFAAHEQSAFTPLALWRVLVDRSKLIIATIAGVFVLAFLAWLFIPRMYSATAVLMLDQRKNSVADVNAVLSGLPADTASIQNQIQILTSRKLAATVIQKQGLDKEPEFGSSSAKLEEVINQVLKRLKVEQAGLATAMTVSVSSADAERSARLTNAWIDAYIEDQLNTKFEATQKAAEWLAVRARQLAAQVQADEAVVQKYKAEHGIVDAGAGSLIDQQTTSVSAQLTAARADLAQKAAAYERIIQLQRAGRAADASQVSGSPLIVQLRAQQADLERQAATLSERFLPKHPKLVDVRAQASGTQARIATEVNRIVEGLANDVAVARANVASLEESLSRLQSSFRDEGNAAVKLKALQLIATSSRSMYEAILSRMKEVQGQEGIATPDVRIVSRAVAPLQASPSDASIFGFAVPGAFALALLFAFVADGLDTTFRSSQHLTRFLGAPSFATVPEIKGATFAPADLALREPSSSFAEAIRGIYLGLTSADPDATPPKVVLVTSAAPGEGKTVIAINLARMAARAGRKVALVDADFRKPSIAKSMGMSSSTTGILQAVRNELSLDKCAVSDPASGVTVFACSEAPRDAAELVGSSAMEKVLSELGSRYDLVVLDSAPLRPVHDTWSLSRFADATLLVVQASRTPRDVVVAAVRALRAMRANLAGVALTRAPDDRRYGDYFLKSGGPGLAGTSH